MNVLSGVLYSFVLAVMAILLAPTQIFAAEPDWFGETSTPTIEKSADMTSAEYSAHPSLKYSPKCHDHTYLTRNFVVIWPLWRQSITSCWYGTSIGPLNINGDYAVAPNGVAGRITNRGSSHILDTPHERTLLEINNGVEHRVKFMLQPFLDTDYSAAGTVTHTLKSADSFTISKQNGYNVIPQNGVNYSNNGRYAVLSTNFEMLRIDLQTRKILSFGKPVPKGWGWNPFTAISISNDGKYAVATVTANEAEPWMRIYNLEDCEDGEYPFVADDHANCTYKDLSEFLEDNIENLHRFGMAAFGNSNTLVFYHYTAGENRTYTKYTLRAYGSSDSIQSYVALGDSYASGEGAYDYFRGTDEGPEINNCHLSKNSYPYVIGKWLKINEYNSVACSGARKINVTGKSLIGSVSDGVVSQAIDNSSMGELGKWHPGFNVQINTIKRELPSAVTISVIGNDVGFADKIKRCMEPDTCYDTFEDRLELLRELRSRFDDLVEIYQDLKAASQTTKIYAIGYPRIGDPRGNCAVNVRLNSGELDFARLYVGQLNSVIKAAAAKAGVFYVDTEGSLDGHGFCEGNDLAINGLTAGNDIAQVIGNESYHPNAKGHNLIAKSIMAKTDEFDAPMPNPDSNSVAPSQEDDLEFLNRPRTNRDIHAVNYDPDLANNIVYRGGTWDAVIDTLKRPLLPLAGFVPSIHSDPVYLEPVYTDEHGNLNAKIEIPSSIPTGYHTLHLVGKDINGETIDIYKVVYIAHTIEDKNGDGLVDALQPCGPFEASGRDVDSDGTDDACDAVISDKQPSSQANLSEPIHQTNHTKLPTWLASGLSDPWRSADKHKNAEEQQAEYLNDLAFGETTKPRATPFIVTFALLAILIMVTRKILYPKNK